LATAGPDFCALQAASASSVQKKKLLSFIGASLGERARGRAEIPDETAARKLLLRGAAAELLKERAGALQHGCFLRDSGDQLHSGGEPIPAFPLRDQLGQLAGIEGGLRPELRHEAPWPALEPTQAQRPQLVLD